MQSSQSTSSSSAISSRLRSEGALWISVSPHLRCFDQRLLSQLVKVRPIQKWEYFQTPDEACCLDRVVGSLHEYLCTRTEKLHLMGHGISAIVALLYAQRYPHKVASLSLLSVASNPAITWQAHYYALRKFLPCSREVVLTQMARVLFGPQPQRFILALSKLLARDLDSSPALHSLATHNSIAVRYVPTPLLLCNGEFDPITVISTQNNSQLSGWLKDSDDIWTCPMGRYFFHFHHPDATATQIKRHWHRLLESKMKAKPTLSSRREDKGSAVSFS